MTLVYSGKIKDKEFVWTLRENDPKVAEMLKRTLENLGFKVEII